MRGMLNDKFSFNLFSILGFNVLAERHWLNIFELLILTKPDWPSLLVVTPESQGPSRHSVWSRHSTISTTCSTSTTISTRQHGWQRTFHMLPAVQSLWDTMPARRCHGVLYFYSRPLLLGYFRRGVTGWGRMRVDLARGAAHGHSTVTAADRSGCWSSSYGSNEDTKSDLLTFACSKLPIERHWHNMSSAHKDIMWCKLTLMSINTILDTARLLICNLNYLGHCWTMNWYQIS